jgi:IS1 family transposase
VRTGNPDSRHISTSFVERQNLTMRMQLRGFTRLTIAFSKKLSHLKAAVALHFAYYNFCTSVDSFPNLSQRSGTSLTLQTLEKSARNSPTTPTMTMAADAYSPYSHRVSMASSDEIDSPV